MSKYLAHNAEKNITIEDNKKRMNIANFINIYIQIYILILYVTQRMTQNKNGSINWIRQYGHVVVNNYCVVFPTSRVSYWSFVSDSANGW